MQEQFLNTAISIGNSICRDAFHHHGQCNWLGVDLDIKGKISKPFLSALRGSWYNGTSGIAWFLAQLYTISNDNRHRLTALGGIEQALQCADMIQNKKLGFHTGLSGIAFSAVEIGEKLGNNDLIERGLQLLQSLNQLPESEYSLDVINGCAGAICAGIRINNKHNSDILNELLFKMGDYLLKKAQVRPEGISWNTMPYSSKNHLTGYGHGAAGIASALLELHQYSQEKRYQKAAFAGFAYEDSHYNPAQENWPDFRELDSANSSAVEQPIYARAWCHGAPGIGLSRFRAFIHTGNERFKESALTATNTTIRLFGLKELGNYSLCHGLFGNADLLHYATDITGNKIYSQKVEEAALEAIKKYELRKIPFPVGSKGDLSSPSMMLGMAGVGYGFLRLVDKKRFRSVLII